MNAPFASASASPGVTPTLEPRFTFPKSCRILRSVEFRQVYDQGLRYQTPFFVAFCLKDSPLPPGRTSARVGFTTPRALGKAVIRNRVRRRIREALRLRLARLNPMWRVVINPRRAAANVPFAAIEREVDKLLTRLAALSDSSSADTSSS